MKRSRPRLPPLAAAKLAAFENPEILGASRQLVIVADLLVTLAEEYQGDASGLVRELQAVVAYLEASRGGASQAIPNALRLMLEGVENRRNLPLEELRPWIVQQVRGYDVLARGWIRAVAGYGANLAGGSTRLLVYDYSSSVAAILRTLGERGQPPAVVVPEARPLDGGRRYIDDLQDSPLRFELIPDAALGSALRTCDLALAGAETISAEGGLFNTTGTFLVALAARYWRVPFYVPSTLVKIDARTLHGHRRPIPPLGPDRLRRLFAETDRSSAVHVDVVCPDLDYVPPVLITGFVTEVGILSPAAISHYAGRFERSSGDG